MPRASGTDAVTAIHAAVRRALDAHVPAAAPVAIALSGGRDSVVLLDALARVAPERGHRVVALHVHHGLSPNADGDSWMTKAWKAVPKFSLGGPSAG